MAAARITRITLVGEFTCPPARPTRTVTQPTMRISPSVSNPSCVTQLKKLRIRDPRVPNGARDTMKAVVPVSGPWRDATPSRRYERLPMTMMLNADQKLKPKPMSSAP